MARFARCAIQSLDPKLVRPLPAACGGVIAPRRQRRRGATFGLRPSPFGLRPEIRPPSSTLLPPKVGSRPPRRLRRRCRPTPPPAAWDDIRPSAFTFRPSAGDSASGLNPPAFGRRLVFSAICKLGASSERNVIAKKTLSFYSEVSELRAREPVMEVALAQQNYDMGANMHPPRAKQTSHGAQNLIHCISRIRLYRVKISQRYVE